MDFLDLLPPAGEDNPAGITEEVYIAPMRAFAPNGLKGVKTTTEPGDSVTIDGDHEFKEGEGFVECYATQDSAEPKITTVGEIDGYGGKVEFEFFHPGVKKEAAEFARWIRNSSCIILVKTQDGVTLQFGTKGLGMSIPSDFSLAKLSGGRRGYTFKVTGYQSGVLYYEGAIALKRDAAPVV
ncbi:hypothetical protein [Pontibacter beigongshangensis]|uniref:hypothetical protein n=1 Tax=Pontibacter beigongshangensis TaxID=2574733 RepID=UPI00164F4F37|nr:hypothetical protein [Pontibacter beigongshangensis]